MDKSTESHLQQVTPKALLEFKDSAFCSFASSSSKNGHFEIGVNAFGGFVVVSKNEVFEFDNTIDAINKYVELLTKED